ncbi:MULTISPECIES: MerR family transcriptional regulator [Phascolarctobacterium]|jgi:DNA-binding transcriptional MerR regulator|uniref:MerR family transcriptional regulator n=1 Tax=Phascolarctobacterium TaxID=33024 RepID=UPI002671D8E2|nr:MULTISPECIES: MerR family transcriptional regulator [Phascolarctobacterium]MDR3831843.1 MerR family transcriptional regulator [Phascolarctobacterium sp.]
MTIREIAAKTNMSTDTLRYYGRIGLLPPVPRNAAGIRNYDEYFVNFINFIKKLKASGMSLEHIIDYIRLAEMGDATIQERKKLLAEARETLLDKINSLQLVAELADYQLRNYENLLQPETYALLNRHPASKALAI